MGFYFSPSVLSADFARLGEAVEKLDKSEADWIHIDVMDGHFVPNISFGFPIIKAIRPYTRKTFDVHLMISNPENYIEDFKKAGADILTIHYEGAIHLHRVLSAIREAGMKAGVALNPHTPVSVLEPVVHNLDVVLIMSVNPGFGGQSFIERTYDKVDELDKLREKHKAGFLIEVDGGVTLENAGALLNAGADALVAGSAVFNTEDIIQTIGKFKSAKKQRIT